MDPPVAAEVETKSEKTDETNGSSKSYECGLCDTEVVYKIAEELLPGLASSCVDNTTGGIFKNAGSVAVDMRKEMADYLTQRSETYVAEFLLTENASGIDVPEHPHDIILTLIDDFAASKRNMFSRVSEWVLSDRREERIDDFVQEMEINGFWLLARREYIAMMLLRNVDYKNAFHCNMICNSEEEVTAHRLECKFRPMDCTSEGCTTRYCAVQKENHEAVCPFMILPCEQKCSDFVMRREMDRHCVTICPMKLVNCAFYTVGCESSIPRCNVQQHNVDNLSSHLLYIVRAAHKEATDEDLKLRVEQVLNLSNNEKLARARDARALTYLIKDAEAKLGPLKVKTKPQADDSPKSPSHLDNNKKESPIKTEPSSIEPTSVVKDGSVSPNKKEQANEMRPSTEKPDGTKDYNAPATKEERPESPTVESAITNRRSESPVERKDKDDSYSSPLEEESESSMKKGEELSTRSLRGENGNTMGEESMKSNKNEKFIDPSNSDDKEESNKLPVEEKSKQLSISKEDDTKKSPKKETAENPSRRDREESLPQRKKTHEPSDSDDEESMKSPTYTEI